MNEFLGATNCLAELHRLWGHAMACPRPMAQPSVFTPRRLTVTNAKRNAGALVADMPWHVPTNSPRILTPLGVLAVPFCRQLYRTAKCATQQSRHSFLLPGQQYPSCVLPSSKFQQTTEIRIFLPIKPIRLAGQAVT